jgi:rhodanese-related sulfurtransferase
MSDIKTINADEAYQMVQENKCNLIDIRELNELELTGRVEGASHIPMGNLETLLDPNSDVFKNGEIDKDKEVVLFCAGGVRSEMSVKSLIAKGYKKISHIEGGFGSISNSNFKIV